MCSVTHAEFREALDQIDWYRRCLEDVQDGVRVRGLDEAKHGYDRAMDALMGHLAHGRFPREVA